MTKKDTDFTWTPSYKNKFNDIKELIYRYSELTYFVPAKDVVIQVDAAGRGLGAVFMHSGKPVLIIIPNKCVIDCITVFNIPIGNLSLGDIDS